MSMKVKHHYLHLNHLLKGNAPKLLILLKSDTTNLFTYLLFCRTKQQDKKIDSNQTSTSRNKTWLQWIRSLKGTLNIPISKYFSIQFCKNIAYNLYNIKSMPLNPSSCKTTCFFHYENKFYYSDGNDGVFTSQYL
jgi:hypothetical protein